MTERKDHYEAAFEDYLRGRDWPYVVVDETRRKAFSGVNLKNFDFLVYSESGPNLVVDVKGRKFPDTSVTGRRRSGRAWENWVTRDDIEGLEQWEGLLGGEFRGVIVFAYWLQGPPDRAPFETVHFFKGHAYAFVAVGAGDYQHAAKPRSAKWGTLTMPAKEFSEMARDLSFFLTGENEGANQC